MKFGIIPQNQAQGGIFKQEDERGGVHFLTFGGGHWTVKRPPMVARVGIRLLVIHPRLSKVSGGEL